MPDKPFFYFDKLTLFDKITIGVYTAFTAYTAIALLIEKPATTSGVYFLYILTTLFLIIFFLYTPLRNFTYYLIWIGFSLVHYLLYFLFKAKHILQHAHGQPLTALMDTSLLLILFQILRFLSLKVQKRDFIVPHHGRDIQTFRKARAFDYIASCVFVVVLILLLKWSF